MAPTPARRAKAMYAVTLVIQCRFSCSSCARPICLSSACRFLSRLSVLMIRLRASTTSLRNAASSLVAAGGSDTGEVPILGVLDSSFICIMLRERVEPARASHEREFGASFSSARPPLGRVRVPFVVRFEEMEHQAQGKQVSAHVQLLRAGG